MAFNDPIAELLTKIRNAKAAKHRFVDIRLSKMKLHIVNILKDQGYLENILVDEKARTMRIFLRYSKGRKSIIQGLRRISTPGLRKYVEYQKIPRICGGLGIAILSTSKGILEGEKAREEKIGGELLCTVW